MALTEAIEIFRSLHVEECEERAFVLMAVGLPYDIDVDNEFAVLSVNAWAYSEAFEHLDHHARENQLREAHIPLPPPVLHDHAWVGCLLYAIILVGVALAIGRGIVRLDAFSLGALDSGKVQQGEWWRAWTALTLHLDAEHLFVNLGAGLWLGYLAARRFGAGMAWALIVSAAAMANLMEALIGPAQHRAVGASTAIFATLGLMAAWTWRERYRLPQPWARRWGPLIAGVILLGWTGSQGENTDVIAHIAGFIVAVVVAVIAATPRIWQTLARVPQWSAGLFALGSIALAWSDALLAP